MSRVNYYFPYGVQGANYLVNCSEKFKYVYVETPKVACSTIKKVLQTLEVDGSQKEIPDNVHDREKSPLLSPLDQSLDLDTLLRGDEYFTFSFVRNPFSRVLSAYLDKIVNNDWERSRLVPGLGFKPTDKIEFLDFLKAVNSTNNKDRDIHWKSQDYILQTKKIDYQFIGRFENFAQGFQSVIEKISPGTEKTITENRTDHHKTNARDKIMQYVGQKEQDLICSIYENDFDEFCYSRDPLFAAI